MTYPHDNNSRDSRGYDSRDPRQQDQRGGYDRRDDGRGQQRGGYDERSQNGRGNAQDSRGGYQQQSGGQQRTQQQREDDLIPEATYRVKCVNHRIGRAGTNNVQIGARLRILDGEHRGKTILWYGTFVQGTAEEITIKAMRALGFKGNNLADCSSMYEGEAEAVVVHERGTDGVLRAKAKWVNGGDIAMAQEMDARDLEHFSRQMMATFARLGGGGGNGQQRGSLNDQGGQQRQPQNTQQSFGGRGNLPPPNDAPPWDGPGGGQRQSRGSGGTGPDDLPF